MAGRCVMPVRRLASVRMCIGACAGILSLGLRAAGGEADPSLSVAEAALFRAVNDYRAARGLGRWAADLGLTLIAREHSTEMLQRQTLTHDGFAARARRTGSRLCVENLVHGAAAPEVALSAWRRSLEHHANLLDAQVKWVGVGVAGRYATLLACTTPAAPAARSSEIPPTVNRP